MIFDIIQFYQIFFDEVDELFVQMEQLLLNFDVDVFDFEDLVVIFCVVYLIKGGVVMFGFFVLIDMMYIFELLFDCVCNYELMLIKDMVDVFLEIKDVLFDQFVDYCVSVELDVVVVVVICVKFEWLKVESGVGVFVVVEVVLVVLVVVVVVVLVVEFVVVGDCVFDYVVEQVVVVVYLVVDVGGLYLKIMLVGVDVKDQVLFIEEFGNFGWIVGCEEVGVDLLLWVELDVLLDDIVVVCCFVIDESQICVVYGMVLVVQVVLVVVQDVVVVVVVELVVVLLFVCVEVFVLQVVVVQLVVLVLVELVVVVVVQLQLLL